MDTSEIDNALQHIVGFQGTKASNSLPEQFEKPAFFVVNTQRWDERGEHWVVMHFLLNNAAEYFDPFGLPALLSDHEQYLKRHATRYVYNSTTLQSPYTSSCGLFCIMFVRLRAAGHTYADIVELFTTNLPRNERMLRFLLRPTTLLAKHGLKNGI